MNRQLK